jgi:phosphoribosylformylglycinamidine synthase
LGVVFPTGHSEHQRIEAILTEHRLMAIARVIGRPTLAPSISIHAEGRQVFKSNRVDLHRLWSKTSWKIQSLRDNPACADQEYDRILDEQDSGLHSKLTFAWPNEQSLTAPELLIHRPQIAILREQGVNGHIEMAAAFDRAGFAAVDVTMSDLLAGRFHLSRFNGLVACGGFSFGDVLGAGQGWGKSILFNDDLREQFSTFFSHDSNFALGVCNGCQMFSAIKSIIPGAQNWPSFISNESAQFEARVTMIEVKESPSLFFAGMAGSRLPVAVSHGEGRVHYDNASDYDTLLAKQQLALTYVDNQGQVSERYPYNPNGSKGGVTGLTNLDGRITLLMPHPERVIRTVTNSWHPGDWGEYSPWLKFFRNAYQWVRQ